MKYLFYESHVGFFFATVSHSILCLPRQISQFFLYSSKIFMTDVVGI